MLAKCKSMTIPRVLLFILLGVYPLYAQNVYQSDRIKLLKTYSTEKAYYDANKDVKKASKISIDRTKNEIKFIDPITNKITQVLNKSELPPINTVIESPDKRTFVAYEERESETPYLYFFSREGKLLNKINVNIYSNVKYTQNGQFVAVYNSFGNRFFIFTANGEEIVSGNYIDLIQNKTSPIHSLLVSEDASHFIVATHSEMYLFRRNKSLVWKTAWKGPDTFILDTYFFSSQNYFALITTSKSNAANNYRLDLKLVSLQHGHVVDSIQDSPQIQFVGPNILLKKNNQFHEYKVY